MDMVLIHLPYSLSKTMAGRMIAVSLLAASVVFAGGCVWSMRKEGESYGLPSSTGRAVVYDVEVYLGMQRDEVRNRIAESVRAKTAITWRIENLNEKQSQWELPYRIQALDGGDGLLILEFIDDKVSSISVQWFGN